MTTNETTNNNIYRIPSQNVDTLLAAIEKLNKRAKRNKLPLITVEEVGTEIEKPSWAQEDAGMKPYVVCLLKIVGTSPRINGWQFLAIIEHTAHGNIIDAIPGETFEGELNDYREIAANCEHCHTNVKRIYTAILKSDKGEYKQVGKSCLKDFTGHKSVEVLAELATQLREAIEGAGEYDPDKSYGSGKGLISLVDFLAYCVASIKRYGFVSKKAAYEGEFEGKIATATDAIDNMFPPKGKEKDYYNATEEDKKEAEKALEWLQQQDKAHANDYMYKLIVVCSGNAIAWKETGVAASLILAYHKAMGDLKEKATKKQSTHQGVEGGKLAVKKVYVKKLLSFESQYGYTYWALMIDQDGNEYKLTSSKVIVEENKTYDISAKVKKHDTYKGVAQTVLYFGKVVMEYEEAA